MRTIKGGVLPHPDDWDEMKEEWEAERVETLMKETLAAVREEKLAQALGELEHELLKVIPVELAEVIEERKLPPRTLSQYRDDLAAFRTWCATYPTPLPHSPAAPQTVAAFLGHLATIGGNAQRAVKAISRAHTNADLADPTTDYLVKAILKYLKDVPRRKSPPIN